MFILSALTRGYAGSKLLNFISKKLPKYADAINTASVAGYTSSAILREIYRNKTGKNLPEQSFMTPYERYETEEEERKKKFTMKAIGGLATGVAAIAAAGLGYNYLKNRNDAIHPSQILPAQRNVGPNPGIGFSPPNIGILPPPPQGPGAPPQGPSPQPPQAPPQQPAPYQPAPVPPNVTTPLSQALKNQRNPLQSIDLVKNLDQQNRFELMLNQGHDDVVTAQLLKMVMPKPAIKAMSEIPGGLESVVQDYRNYINDQKKQQESFANQSVQFPQETNVPMNPQEEINQQQQMPQQSQQPQQEAIQLPSTIPQKEISNIFNDDDNEIESIGNLAITPKGHVGEVESIENGVAKINVNGKTMKMKTSDIIPEEEAEEVESAVRKIINSIPEKMKSTQLASMVHVPNDNLLLVQFHDGKWAWYKDFPEDLYRKIAIGSYAPKGKGRTSIAEYNPNAADSRGAGFDVEVKKNPRYSKDNMGKTWGYANNEYSLLHHVQKSFQKVSQEKLDENGNVIQPKKRTKK